MNELDQVFYGQIRVKKAASLLYFSENGIVKSLLHHLKYKNQESISGFLGKWFGNTIKNQGDLQGIDYVIPVPLHPKKLKKRGYNQVDGFAKNIAEELKTNFLGDALLKTANTKTQTKKSRIFRLNTNEQLYKINTEYHLDGAKILLTDDVVTTGATIEACTKAMGQFKDIEIYVATMAFVPKLGF